MTVGWIAIHHPSSCVNIRRTINENSLDIIDQDKIEQTATMIGRTCVLHSGYELNGSGSNAASHKNDYMAKNNNNTSFVYNVAQN